MRYLLLCLLLLTGCPQQPSAPAPNPQQTSTELGNGLQRFETEEAVCLATYAGGGSYVSVAMQCKWKDKK